MTIMGRREGRWYLANGTPLTELPGTIKIKVHTITFKYSYEQLLWLCGGDELLDQDEDIKAGL